MGQLIIDISLVSLVLFSCLFFDYAKAELLECMDCCRSDQTIGVTSFSSNITSAGPLTWSVASSTDDDQTEGIKQYQRSFYLSAPSELDLPTTDFAGCGLFFYNLTAQLQLPDDFTDYDNYTCNQFMSTQCQQDLLQQARDTVNSTLHPEDGPLAPGQNVLGLCQSFSSLLQTSAVPQSCAFAQQQGKWGFTDGQPISGYALVNPDQSCPVTNNSSYTSYLTAERYAQLEPDSEEAKAFQNGSTAVLSVFFNLPDRPSNLSFLAQPELHLSCLQTRPTEEQQAKINVGISRKPNTSAMLGLLVVVASTVFQVL